jgi:lysophospholipid acyltransferase (LPLAT)-like uncharacterized protein
LPGNWPLRNAAATERGLIASPASALGRHVARYSRLAIKPDRIEILLETALAGKPTLWVCWHEANMIALALHGDVTARQAMAFVPPGFNGAGMRGWLEGLGITPVPLASDARRGLGLRQMEAALADGKDVLIAIDGPSGPRHKISPGAIWLAKASGVDIRPFGAAAYPALRLPRWDRLIVPLPFARICVAIGAALSPTRDDDGSGLAAEISAALDRLASRARLKTLQGVK